MASTWISRRLFARQAAVLPLALGALNAGAQSGRIARPPELAGPDGLDEARAAIHQTVVFQVAPRRVYEALTESVRFDAITRLSDAVALVTAPDAKPTAISSEVGGSFTLFGGYITGRNLVMLPGARLVQAWRAGSWKAHAYSIVDFALSEDGGGAKLDFTHRGFPDGEGPSLASGWHVHYWTPLAKYLQG